MGTPKHESLLLLGESSMTAFPEWLLPTGVGASSTKIGALKGYGLSNGTIGGGGKPLPCRLLARCPTWSKPLHLIHALLPLRVGIVKHAVLLALFLKSR